MSIEHPMAEPQASVVIRARNEAGCVGRVLDALDEQTVLPAEIVFVDSGSTDGTVEIARDHNARLLLIAPEDFSYGRALNLGTLEAGTPLVVYLSAHAVPDSPHWLEILLEPLLQDSTIGAVFSRQRPHPGCNPLQSLEIEKAYDDIPRRYTHTPPFSNASAAVRRELVLQVPFDEAVAYAEDRIWAEKICKAGWAVQYEPGSAVLHSHDETFPQLLRRQRREVRESVQHLHLKTALTHWWMVPPALCWGMARDWFRLLRSCEHPAWFFRAPAFRLAKVLGTWHGCRDAVQESP